MRMNFKSLYLSSVAKMFIERGGCNV